MHYSSGIRLAMTFAAILACAPTRAETPADFLASFDKSARSSDSGFSGFSAQRGEQFFSTKHGDEWSCTSCHTPDPAANGRHAKTGKSIAPLAPAANAERFTNPSKVAKWFKRNCNDVLGRECTAQEKGDALTYLLSVRP
jgi:hypothetical protein